jgi:hypothetical protein
MLLESLHHLSAENLASLPSIIEQNPGFTFAGIAGLLALTLLLLNPEKNKE